MRFNFCLTHANLSSQFRDINIGYYVTQILDAVCNAYHEEDCLLLQTFCDFLKDLSIESRYREELEKSITLEFIQQIFLVLDFSQGNYLIRKLFQQMLNSSYSILNLNIYVFYFPIGNNRANELMYRFAREAMPLYAGNIHSLFEVRRRLEYRESKLKGLIKLDSKSSYLLIFIIDNCANSGCKT